MRRLVFTLFALTAALSLGTPALADERAPLMEIPDAAHDTIEEHVGEGTVYEIERATENGDIVYEVGYRSPEGDEYELEVSEDGELLSKERANGWGPWGD